MGTNMARDSSKPAAELPAMNAKGSAPGRSYSEMRALAKRPPAPRSMSPRILPQEIQRERTPIEGIRRAGPAHGPVVHAAENRQ